MTVPAASGNVLQEPWGISYDYDANGQVVQSTTSDGWSKAYVYDVCGRCVGLSVQHGEEEVYHVQYTLDRNGRRVSATEMDGDGERKCFWTNDELGRLVEERIETADGKEIRGWTGGYDATGNLLEERWRINGRDSATRTCQVDDDDCLISSVDMTAEGRSETHYEWNGNGELVKAVTTGSKSETREWSWNADGRLAGVVIVTPSSRVEVTYEYDLEGILKRQSVRRREGGRDETEHREFRFETVSHGGMAMLLEMTEERNGLRTTRSFLHGHELEGWVEDGQICHVWADGSHGIRGMRQDAVITSFATDAWGVEEVPHDGFGYAGEWQDATTGLVYLRGRFYWPEIRRFISVDRHPADMVNPQGWHRYAYCLNDPVNNRDPLGEFVMTATMLMTLKLVAFYTCFRMLANAYYDVQHAEMMENMLKIRKRYYENATIVVHGVTEHEVNWTENFSDTLEKCSGNQDMYEFLWSGFQAGGFVLFFPHHLSHTIASKSLVYCLCELYMKGYANVNVIAHSWGTVLSRDAMNSSGLSFGLWATMGSPLGETFPKFGYRMWQNFYSSEDGVPLLTWLLFLLGYSDNLKPLFMQRINVQQHKTYSGGPIDAHSSYWTDPTVFNDILSVLKWQ
jgi:RHS repeat-associated protein